MSDPLAAPASSLPWYRPPAAVAGVRGVSVARPGAEAGTRTGDDDASVVARVLGGDADAFAVLVRRHHGRCLRYAERTLGDHADAEDAVQQAFVRAYDALGRYEERARFGAWLLAILAGECRTIAAARARRARRFVDGDDVLLRLSAPERDAAPDAGARLERALGRLEPRLREAFLLRHVEGLSYDEMQAATGAGTSALKMRVKRACDGLRALLEAP